MASTVNQGTVFRDPNGVLAIRAHNANVPTSDYFVVDPSNTGWRVADASETATIEAWDKAVDGPAPAPDPEPDPTPSPDVPPPPSPPVSDPKSSKSGDK
jgi:hypothetical protein